ncbi:YfbU family protein [Desulfobacula sp.]|uniref:YfbU family protein n=1 Tax=Desulfobacula sp. TaxID=2593537 RepID=UPI00261D9800|nr:YfbU family protein [Desulfobacula sp.]
MQLSNGEKLILIMLSEIYEKMGVEGELDPGFIRSAIFSKNEWGLEWKYSGIPFEKEETPALVKEVVNILDMWSFIEDSYKKTSNDEKKQIKEEAEPFGEHVKFSGFDGNNESEYLNVAHFFINDLKSFLCFEGRGLNSHCPSIEVHRRMYDVFEPMRAEAGSGLLSSNQIIEILKAKIHPDRR